MCLNKKINILLMNYIKHMEDYIHSTTSDDFFQYYKI